MSICWHDTLAVLTLMCLRSLRPVCLLWPRGVFAIQPWGRWVAWATCFSSVCALREFSVFGWYWKASVLFVWASQKWYMLPDSYHSINDEYKGRKLPIPVFDCNEKVSSIRYIRAFHLNQLDLFIQSMSHYLCRWYSLFETTPIYLESIT